MLDVVWFKRDLRVHDNAALASAAAGGGVIAPLYILEPEPWAQPEMSGRHYAFLRECLAELDLALAARGGRLIVRVDDAVAALADLHARFGIARIHAHEETGLGWTYARDRRVRAFARKAGIAMIEHRQFGVVRALPTRDGWSRRWERLMNAPRLPAPEALRILAMPSELPPDPASLGLAEDPCPGRQIGGRSEGVALLRSFLATRGREYRAQMSNPVGGAAACSRLSPHLAFGTVSMRETHQAAARALAHHEAQGDAGYAASLRSFASRLRWHCHFMQKLEDEPAIEREALHPAYASLRPPADPDVLAAWAEGRTGFPFVDACMRALRDDGWLNFRMRAMTMAFASYHLWLDWRAPALVLARLFTDFEPGIHYPQAQMQSGSTGVNIARIYNPVKQSLDQDPNGDFIRRHCPELAGLPAPFIHEPWRAPGEALAAAGVRLGETYPERIVDHLAAAASARERIYAVRQGADFDRAAAAIQDKHGSRKAGLPATGRRRRKRDPAPELDFS